MTAFVGFISTLSRLFGIFAACLVGAAILVVSQMVVMRYFLNASTIWQTEFVTFSLVAATFIGSPYVALIKGHVNVDLLPHYLGPGGRKALTLIAASVSVLFAVVVAWTGFGLWLEAWTENWRTDTVWSLPLWIPYIAMPLGIGLMALQYIVEIVCVLSGRDLPFGPEPGGRP